MYSKNKIGRPLKFTTPEDMQEKIDAYFDECDKEKRPYTVTGLALALDTDRITLLEYENANDENFKRLTKEEQKAFSNTIKRAKERCQKYAEEQLFRTGGQVAGVIFNMKNNYAWKDQQEIINTNNNISVELDDDKD